MRGRLQRGYREPVDHLDHADVAGTGAQGRAQDRPGRDPGRLVDARVEAGVAGGVLDQGRPILMKHPARDADVRGKADLVERAGCRLPAGRLAGHREKQPTSLLVEQQHGAALGPEQLAYPLRRVAEQRVEVGEGRDRVRDVVEELQTVGGQADQSRTTAYIRGGSCPTPGPGAWHW